MEYRSLTTEQMQAMIQQRITQFEAEHFSHAMNLATLASSPDSEQKDQQIAAARNAQETIESAIDALVGPAIAEIVDPTPTPAAIPATTVPAVPTTTASTTTQTAPPVVS